MSSLGFDVPLRQQCRCLLSERGSRSLLYAPATGAVAVVNRAGREVWDLFAVPRTPRQAVRARGANQTWTRPCLARFLAFVERLAEQGFLIFADSAPVSTALASETGADPSRDRLSEVYLHVTGRCNLRCLYCYSADFRAQCRADEELTSDELFRLLDQIAALGTERVVFSGGEPLLRSDCLEVARHARRRGLGASCLTNGTLLAAQAEAVAEAFDQVIVSLDSWRAAEQESLRPGGRLTDIVRGVRALVATGRTRVWIRPVITHVNLASLPGFPQYAAANFTCTDFMVALCSATTVRNLANLAWLPDPEAYRAALREFHAALAQVGGSSSLETVPLETAGRCGAGTGLLSIAPNGDVYPCQCLHVPELQAGNVRTAGLREIWEQSPPLRHLRAQPPPRFPACRECPITKLGSLTCRAVQRAFQEDASRFTAAMCPFARLEAEERLWKEADRVRAAAESATGPEVEWNK